MKNFESNRSQVCVVKCKSHYKIEMGEVAWWQWMQVRGSLVLTTGSQASNPGLMCWTSHRTLLTPTIHTSHHALLTHPWTHKHGESRSFFSTTRFFNNNTNRWSKHYTELDISLVIVFNCEVAVRAGVMVSPGQITAFKTETICCKLQSLMAHPAAGY